MKQFTDDIKECIKVLRSGGVILYPTDTVWGLGCDATREDAVEKVFQIKQRSESKSLITLTDSIAMTERYVREMPEAARSILDVSDKPITIVYPSCRFLAKNAVAEDGSAGIRITDDIFCLALLEAFRKPVVSTSANISGEPAPSHFGEISQAILGSVDYTVKYRQEDRERRQPSPVIKVEANGVITIIRK